MGAIADSISDLATDLLTIQRSEGAYDDTGVYVPGEPVVFQISAVVEPAIGMARVIGGTDLLSRQENASATTTISIWTTTELRTRTPANDPDLVVGYQGATWTIARIERWPGFDGDVYWRALATRQTSGAS